MAARRTRTAVNDCTCDTFTRPHGTQHNYQYHGCGCEPCRDAYMAYLRDLRHRKANGQGAYVPVGPARDRLHALAERGLTIPQIAEHLGYTASALYSISRAARPTCRREVAADILTHPLPSRDGKVRNVNRKAAA